MPAMDADDDKYGRKTILDRLGIRAFLKRLSLMQQNPGFNRKLIIGGIAFFAILILYLLISSVSEEEELVKIS
jgi:hypothetical protein